MSLEFEEVRSLADRILVIYEGEIVGEFPPDVSEEELGHRDDRRGAGKSARVSDEEVIASRRRRRRRGWPPTCAAAA